MQYKFKDQITNLEIHLYITQTTEYIIKNYQKLLPNWQNVPQNLIIFLFQSQLELNEDNYLIQQEKDRLKIKFLELAKDFKELFNANLEIICPQTGKPINSNFNQETFDLVAVVNKALAIKFKPTNHNCKVLCYPDWETAVYPCLIVSDSQILIDKNNLNKFCLKHLLYDMILR